MGIKTEIGWCDSTGNDTTGCEGCELWNGRDIRICYAGNIHERRLAKSLPHLYAKDFQEVRLAPGRMMEAAGWSDLTGKARSDKPWLNGKPRMIFVGDMGDFCSKAVPDDYIVDEIFGAIRSPKGQRHFLLLLTKQIHRLAALSKKIGGLPGNSMAMTSITYQHFADHRMPSLLNVDCKWRGVSAEPLFGPITLKREWLERIDWMIIGGVSGDSYNQRTMDLAWLEDLAAQCKAANVPVFVKQDSAFRPGMQGRISDTLCSKEIPDIHALSPWSPTLFECECRYGE
jgi:protein gp37